MPTNTQQAFYVNLAGRHPTRGPRWITREGTVTTIRSKAARFRGQPSGRCLRAYEAHRVRSRRSSPTPLRSEWHRRRRSHRPASTRQPNQRRGMNNGSMRSTRAALKRSKSQMHQTLQ